MAEITASMVKELREQTGSGMMDCKRALAETNGDLEKALDYLRKKGLAKAQKRAGRATSEGIIYTYIHAGAKLGVMVEVNCESDFVAKTADFQEFAKNVAMHIAAANPRGLNPEDIPQSVIDREREIYRAQCLEQGKPENIVDKIVEGQVQKFYKDSCLMSQQYIKDPKKTVAEMATETIGKIGENITVKRFVRFQVGE
ncbi:MAG: translation elongation factor Ts [Desulfamplus sp.]|nr:translation elongation factor Ts [Desulfamplus sp.]MBF0411342.1 translation elongation factor Ts [Desulfamplus sp.]